jgi:hypothetical protein
MFITKCPRCNGHVDHQHDVRWHETIPCCLQCGWAGETFTLTDEQHRVSQLRESALKRTISNAAQNIARDKREDDAVAAKKRERFARMDAAKSAVQRRDARHVLRLRKHIRAHPMQNRKFRDQWRVWAKAFSFSIAKVRQVWYEERK